MRRSLPALAAAVALSACALKSVGVVYPRPDTPVSQARARALGNLYLLIERPGPPEDDAAQRALVAADGTPDDFPVACGIFAGGVAKAAAALGGYVLAYRATDDADAPDPFLPELKPSGTLFARFGPLALERTETEAEEKVKDKDGKEKVVRIPLWRFKASLGVRFLLRAEPGKDILAASDFTIETEAKVPRLPNEEKSRLDWYEEAQDKLLSQAAARLLPLVGAMPSERRLRAIHTDEKDPESKAARKAASRGDWEKASELWASRLDSGRGDWRELMNLAVAAEMRREFQEAGRIYRLARERAASSKDPGASTVGWDALLGEVDGAAGTVGLRSRAAQKWFGAPLAVLPFSDETTSVDGPGMVRSMVREALRKGGYAVLELEDVDRGLRAHGFSQGGQLRRVKPAKIASWLKADRVLFGNVTHFEDIMLGAYGRRKVAGVLSLWDKGAGEPRWSSQVPASRESLTLNAGKAAGAFMGQLLRGLGERIVGKPLYSESALFVERNLETLPLAPQR